MDTNIYNDKIIVFKSSDANAIKAASEIDNESWTRVMIYDSVVVVSFANSVERPEFDRHLKDLFNKCVGYVTKYNIEYKIKGMRF